MPADLPRGLRRALEERGATVERTVSEPPRTFTWAGPWFGRSTADPGDEALLAHEVRMRALVGDRLPLRAPPVEAHGAGWTLERRVHGGPPAGPAQTAAAVEAAVAIPALDLPPAPVVAAGRAPERMARVARLGRMARARVRPVDVVRARRTWAATPLPLVPSHGDFHTNNILAADDGPWVVDWELCGPRPLGADLLQLWATLAAPEDRALALDAARRQVGAARLGALRELQHAVVVRSIAGVLDPAPGGVGDLAALRQLLEGLR